MIPKSDTRREVEESPAECPPCFEATAQRDMEEGLLRMIGDFRLPIEQLEKPAGDLRRRISVQQVDSGKLSSLPAPKAQEDRWSFPEQNRNV